MAIFIPALCPALSGLEILAENVETTIETQGKSATTEILAVRMLALLPVGSWTSWSSPPGCPWGLLPWEESSGRDAIPLSRIHRVFLLFT